MLVYLQRQSRYFHQSIIIQRYLYKDYCIPSYYEVDIMCLKYLCLMRVCMCMYMCVCTYVCMHVCMYVYVCMCVCMCMYACVYHEYRIMCISILQISYYVYQHIHRYRIVCMHLCMYVCIQHSIDIVLYVLVHYEYRIACIQHIIDIVLCVFSIKQENVEKQDLQGLGYDSLCLSLFPDLYDKTYLVAIAVRKAIGISTSCLISVYRVICIQYNIDILL